MFCIIWQCEIGDNIESKLYKIYKCCLIFVFFYDIHCLLFDLLLCVEGRAAS